MSMILRLFLRFFIFITGYRSTVVNQNLDVIAAAHPDLIISDSKKRFQSYFPTLLSEIISSYFLKQEEVSRLATFVNSDLVQKSIQESGGAFLLTAHHGNWELASLALSSALKGKIGAIYLPLSNKRIENWVKKKRIRFGVQFISPRELLNLIRKNHDLKALCFVADQAPGGPEHADWIPFFGRTTAFSPGIERLPRILNWPVYYASIRRRENGVYQITFELLCDTPRSASKGELLNKYVDCLEREVTQAPHQWLLTHRRWKHQAENYLNITKYDRHSSGGISQT